MRENLRIWFQAFFEKMSNLILQGEPNNAGSGEDCVQMYMWDGTWNDIDCNERTEYVCEIYSSNTHPKDTIQITSRVKLLEVSRQTFTI